MIGLCTDSNAQLPAELVDRYGVEVVPLTVTLDGDDFLEGVNLDADGFYRAHGWYEEARFSPWRYGKDFVHWCFAENSIAR